MKNNVVKLRPLDNEPEDELEDELEFDDGDGGGPTEIVIRVIHEYPEIEDEPEPKSSSWGAFGFGALLGFLLGG